MSKCQIAINVLLCKKSCSIKKVSYRTKRLYFHWLWFGLHNNANKGSPFSWMTLKPTDNLAQTTLFVFQHVWHRLRSKIEAASWLASRLMHTLGNKSEKYPKNRHNFNIFKGRWHKGWSGCKHSIYSKRYIAPIWEGLKRCSKVLASFKGIYISTYPIFKPNGVKIFF